MLLLPSGLARLEGWGAGRVVRGWLGRQRGYRALRGGRAPGRRVLYLAALSAIGYNAPLRRFYPGLRPCGKPGKVALVAVMRMLLLHALARRGTPWVAQKALAA